LLKTPTETKVDVRRFAYMSQRVNTNKTLYNAFTRSYRTRYIVHACYRDDTTTICGRDVFKIGQNAKFDRENDTSCRKCIQQLDIAERIHPGWKG
jgi:hypothetical protein